MTTTQLWTIGEAAERLRCSEMTVYRLITRGHLKAVDISTTGRSKTRVRDDDLAAFIEDRTRQAS